MAMCIPGRFDLDGFYGEACHSVFENRLMASEAGHFF